MKYHITMTTSTQHLVLQNPLENTQIKTTADLIIKFAKCSNGKANEIIDRVRLGESVGILSDNPRVIQLAEKQFLEAKINVFISLDDIYAEKYISQIQRRLANIKTSV